MHQNQFATSKMSAAGRALSRGIRSLDRRKLVLLAIVAVVAGVAMNWSALAAAGMLPLIAFLPCLAMCALGMCKKGGDGGSCSKSGGGEGKP